MKDKIKSILMISFILFTIILGNIIFSQKQAYARIDILPQKIVMEKRDRNAEFTVLNLLNTTGTFRIEIVNFRQNEQGVYTEIKEPLDL